MAYPEDQSQNRTDYEWLYGPGTRKPAPTADFPTNVVPRRIVDPPASSYAPHASSSDWSMLGGASAPQFEPPEDAYVEDNGGYDPADYEWLNDDDTSIIADEDVTAGQSDDGGKSSNRGRSKTKRARRRKIIRRSIIAVVVVLALIAGTIGYVVWKASNTICEVTSGDNCNLMSTLQNAQKVMGMGPAPTFAPLAADASGRTNILVLGTSDDRKDTGGGGMLTDSIIVLSVSATDHNAFMISIPRDLWVQYPGWCSFGYQGKVNVAYECVGAAVGNSVAKDQAALKAVIPVYQTITGLKIQYAVNLNYSVLKSLVRAVGGSITVKIKTTDSRGLYDINTKLKLSPKSKECPSASINPMVCTLNPQQTLALARARNSDGGYGLAASNFNREQNQQSIVIGLMDKASSNGLFTDLSGVTTALDGIGKNLRTTFSVDEIPSLMNLARNIPAANIVSLDMINANPSVVTTGMVSNQSSVIPRAGLFNYSAIHSWIKKSISSNPVIQESATIDILSTPDQTVAATNAAQKLKSLGYKIGNMGDYTGTVTTTQIFDITRAKPLTSSALAKQFGVTVTVGKPKGYTVKKGIDFVVIIGS